MPNPNTTLAQFFFQKCSDKENNQNRNFEKDFWDGFISFWKYTLLAALTTPSLGLAIYFLTVLSIDPKAYKNGFNASCAFHNISEKDCGWNNYTITLEATMPMFLFSLAVIGSVLAGTGVGACVFGATNAAIRKNDRRDGYKEITTNDDDLELKKQQGPANK